MGKVLIACEESQAVCIEFRKQGHDRIKGLKKDQLIHCGEGFHFTILQKNNEK